MLLLLVTLLCLAGGVLGSSCAVCGSSAGSMCESMSEQERASASVRFVC